MPSWALPPAGQGRCRWQRGAATRRTWRWRGDERRRRDAGSPALRPWTQRPRDRGSREAVARPGSEPRIRVRRAPRRRRQRPDRAPPLSAGSPALPSTTGTDHASPPATRHSDPVQPRAWRPKAPSVRRRDDRLCDQIMVHDLPLEPWPNRPGDINVAPLGRTLMCASTRPPVGNDGLVGQPSQHSRQPPAPLTPWA